MNLSTGSIVSLTPTPPEWTVTLDWKGDQTATETCPVIGWAIVAAAHLNDGTTSTSLEPAFCWDGTVYTESDLRAYCDANVVVTVQPPTMSIPPLS